MRYVRFWVVKTMIRAQPHEDLRRVAAVCVLPAAVGSQDRTRVVILSKHVPVCTDLLTIGSGTIIRKEVHFLRLPGTRRAYPDRRGHPRPGRVHRREIRARHQHVHGRRSAARAHVQLAHRAGIVPAGERWHGSPSQHTTVNYLRVPSARTGRFRSRTSAPCSALTLLNVFLIVLPDYPGRAGTGYVPRCLRRPPWPTPLPLDIGSHPTVFYLNALILSAALFGGCVLLGLVLVTPVVPLLLEPGHRAREGLYPLYGFHYGVHPRDHPHHQHQVLPRSSSGTARTSSTTCAALGYQLFRKCSRPGPTSA